MREEGLVAMCMVNNCSFNMDNKCHAPSVNVSFDNDHADCATFTPR